MSIDLKLKPNWDRWYNLIDHPVQVELMNAIKNGVRFPVVPAGRRSGKTERFKRFIVKQAWKNPNELYFAGAPTYQQVKKIFWQDLKRLSFSSTFPKSPSESDLIIYFPNGSEIHLIGFDKPERFEGIPWTGGGIDEIADTKPDAWELNISPALDTVNPKRPDYRAWCWLFGVPDGLNHFYDICELAKQEVDGFKLFHWKSSEILPHDVIEEAQRRLSAKQFRQEYEGCHLGSTNILMCNGKGREIRALIPGDEVMYSTGDGVLEKCKVLKGGITGQKEIIKATLETGETITASQSHPFKTRRVRVPLKEISEVDCHFVQWKPKTKAQCLAAIVGYNISDGTITHRKQRNKFTASFYGGRDEMNDIADCCLTVFGEKPRVGFKKGSRKEYDSYQVQLCDKKARTLIKAGCPVGRKTKIQFDVPMWVMKTKKKNIKRAFVASVWGAEGTCPRVSNKTMDMPVIAMHKAVAVEDDLFFKNMGAIMKDLGVNTVLKNGKSTTGSVRRLYVCSGVENILAFLQNCGYLFAFKKTKLSWLWEKYLKFCIYSVKQLKESVRLISAKNGYAEAGRELGISKGRAWRLANSKDAQFRIPNSLPTFDKWVDDRLEKNILRLRVRNKESAGQSLTYNISVSSPDHSYLLYGGIDNYNSFETVTGRIYEDYGAANYTKEEIKPHELLHWMHDQNFTPLSSAIGVIREDKLYLLDEIVLESAISRQSAEEFVERYKNHENKQVYIYGDPAGRAGEKHGHASDYTEIEDVLKRNGWKFIRKVKPKHPSIKDRQNSVRAMICNTMGERKLFVNTQKAPYCHKGLATVQVKTGSSFLEQDSKYQHITTAIGYMVDYLWPVNSPQSTIHRVRAN